MVMEVPLSRPGRKTSTRLAAADASLDPSSVASRASLVAAAPIAVPAVLTASAVDAAVAAAEPAIASPAGTGTGPIGSSFAFTEIPWTRIDLDLYEVARDGYIVGYVEVVGAVFVALGGTRYDRAVEVSQHLTFHAAIDALLRRAV